MTLPWDLGVSSLGKPDASLPELLALAEAHGCAAVELRSGQDQAVHPGLDAAGRREVRRRCDQAAVRIAAVASYVRLCGEEPADEELAAHLQLAADVGAAGVRVFPGGDGSAAAAERGRARLERAAEVAAGLDVRVLVETHDSHPTGADVARLLRSAGLDGGDRVGVIWDVVHPWVAGESPAATWQALAPYLAHVQIKDVAERRPGATPALVGDGVLPLDEVAGVLSREGYRGPLVLEWEKPWHPDIADLAVALASAREWLTRASG